VNDGVEESPPSKPVSNGSPGRAGPATSPDSSGLFINLESANVGFKHWHPISVAEMGNELRGQSDLGGAWEWTSTVLERHQGYEPMSLYPGYSGTYVASAHSGIF
jgi:formylglycine-generating enzyme required for sulfatase activity